MDTPTSPGHSARPAKRRHPAAGARKAVTVASLGAFVAISGTLMAQDLLASHGTDTNRTTTTQSSTDQTGSAGQDTSTTSSDDGSWGATAPSADTATSGSASSAPTTSSHGS